VPLPSRSQGRRGNRRATSGHGAHQAASDQREQRPHRARQDQASVGDARDSGRQYTADETEPDQTDCGPHDNLPPGDPRASEMPSSRQRGVGIEPSEMLTVVTGSPIAPADTPCNLYSIIITLTVPPRTGEIG